MGVKTIFKTLIGTIAIMVLGSLIVEMFNISIASMQLKQMTKIAARNACVLFTQETYKQQGEGGMIKSADIKYTDPVTGATSLYCSGDFYKSNDPNEVYEDLYKDNKWFKKFSNIGVCSHCGGTPYSDLHKIKTLGILHKAADTSNYLENDSISWDWSVNQANEEYAKMIAYRNNMYTPVNLGIPYLDIYEKASESKQSIVNRMYRWELTQLLTDCNSALIQKDDVGNICVNYKGFKCYTGDAYWSKCRLSDTDYMVFDITSSSDRAKMQNYLNYYTPADKKSGGVDSPKLDVDTLGGEQEENKYITAVGIKYTIPVRYEGITPLRRIISYLWEHSNMQGMEEIPPVAAPGEFGYAGGKAWNDSVDASLATEGGFKAETTTMSTWEERRNKGFYPASGKLVYTLVR